MIRFNLRTIGLRDLDRRIRLAGEGAQHAMAVQMAKDTEPYVPAMTKSLSNRTIVTGNVIVYPGPYARFLYYGKLMIDPNTGSSWAPIGASKVVTGTDLNISQSVHRKAQAHWFEASKAQNLQKWRNVAARVISSDFSG